MKKKLLITGTVLIIVVGLIIVFKQIDIAGQLKEMHGG